MAAALIPSGECVDLGRLKDVVTWIVLDSWISGASLPNLFSAEYLIREVPGYKGGCAIR